MRLCLDESMSPLQVGMPRQLIKRLERPHVLVSRVTKMTDLIVSSTFNTYSLIETIATAGLPTFDA